MDLETFHFASYAAKANGQVSELTPNTHEQAETGN